jgi:hypothetical protein
MAQVINVNIAPEQEINVNIVEQKVQVDIQGAILYEAGSTLDETIFLINLETSNLIPGELVFSDTNSTGCYRATSNLTPAIGFVFSETLPTESTSIITVTGKVLTLDSWIDVTNSSTLIPNQTYYLSTEPGKLVTTPDLSTALFVQPIGIAISSTTMKYQIGEPVWL